MIIILIVGFLSCIIMNLDILIQRLEVEESAKRYCLSNVHINLNDFYGLNMERILQNCKLSKTYIANLMGIDSRTFCKIKSVNDKWHRDIRFYEALMFIVITNLTVANGLAFLSNCNFHLCIEKTRDRIIFDILNLPHKNDSEMMARLECLQALKDNEPFNDNKFDYLTLFRYVMNTI